MVWNLLFLVLCIGGNFSLYAAAQEASAQDEEEYEEEEAPANASVSPPAPALSSSPPSSTPSSVLTSGGFSPAVAAGGIAATAQPLTMPSPSQQAVSTALSTVAPAPAAVSVTQTTASQRVQQFDQQQQIVPPPTFNVLNPTATVALPMQVAGEVFMKQAVPAKNEQVVVQEKSAASVIQTAQSQAPKNQTMGRSGDLNPQIEGPLSSLAVPVPSASALQAGKETEKEATKQRRAKNASGRKIKKATKRRTKKTASAPQNKTTSPASSASDSGAPSGQIISSAASAPSDQVTIPASVPAVGNEGEAPTGIIESTTQNSSSGSSVVTPTTSGTL